jgi:hypothetical protein
MIRQGVVEDCEVLIDEHDASILVYKQCGSEWVLTLNYKARNLRVLAEHLSDQIGYGPAVQLLGSWQLPPEHPLWTLNHKGGLNHFTDR